MVLKVENLVKKFEGQTILDNVSFSIKKGEVVSILGKSGAGKTTLLRCVNGIEDIDGGSIIVDGTYLFRKKEEKIYKAYGDDMKKIRNSIGYVFQNFNLFPHINVLENLILSPTLVYKIDKEKAIGKAFEILETLSIKDKAYSYPFELSGGQKQRVAIARACMLSPKILCFDEPTSSVDDEVKRTIFNIIKELSKNDMAILLVTHDKLFANEISNRILQIENGKII